jgi:hypothetical protein
VRHEAGEHEEAEEEVDEGGEDHQAARPAHLRQPRGVREFERRVAGGRQRLTTPP